jgi:hypothetical protein
MAECKKPIGLYAIKRDPRNPNYWWEETLIKAFNTEEAAEKFKVMVTTGTFHKDGLTSSGSPRITKYDKILEKYPELVVMPINHTIKC